MEDEINLRDLIEVIFRGKKLIIGITLAAVLCGSLYSFFMLPPQYEGRATVMVNQTKFAQPKSESNLDALMQVLSGYPEMTLETYRSQVTNPVVLKKVIDELKLDPEKHTISGLGNSIETEVVKNTNLINITVKGNDPAEVARIANAVAVNFVDFISGQSRQQLGQSQVFLKNQMDAEEKNLEELLEEYKKFLSQPRGVQELKAEAGAKVALLTDFKSQMMKNNVAIQQVNSTLVQVENDLAQTPEKLVLKKSISEDPYLLQVLGDATGSTPRKLSGLSMESEVINHIYSTLGSKRAELRTRLADLDGQQRELENVIGELQQDLEKLLSELAEKQTIDEQLSQKVKTLRENYKILSTRSEETRLSQSAKMGDVNISILSPAREPELPVGPRRMLNMAVAGVLGIMVSVFLVFFLEYWRNSNPQERQNSVNI